MKKYVVRINAYYLIGILAFMLIYGIITSYNKSRVYRRNLDDVRKQSLNRAFKVDIPTSATLLMHYPTNGVADTGGDPERVEQ